MRSVINLIKNLLAHSEPINVQSTKDARTISSIIPRDQHNISRKNISTNCRKVLYRLRKANYDAYLVGGSVRDLLLGHEPKDFDIATNATPEQVRALFRNSRLIGRRFRLAHIYFKHEIIEVATFRANNPSQSHVSQAGLVLQDNIYGSIEDDVVRRDFTINALLYDIKTFTVIDYVNGIKDLNDGLIRLIGDPAVRYREDPVRILRAIRFAAKLGFQIEPKTAAPINQCATLLAEVPPARLLEEINKLFLGGKAASIFSLLLRYDLFRLLFPTTQQCLDDKTQHLTVDEFLQAVFKATDARVAERKPVTMSFLFASMLWHPMLKIKHQYQAEGFREMVALEKASDDVLSAENKIISIPRRMGHLIKEVWSAQSYLEVRKGKRPFRMVHHHRFRAAFDFLSLRSAADPTLVATVEWWQEFSQAKTKQQHIMIEQLQKHKRKKKNNNTSRKKKFESVPDASR